MNFLMLARKKEYYHYIWNINNSYYSTPHVCIVYHASNSLISLNEIRREPFNFLRENEIKSQKKGQTLSIRKHSQKEKSIITKLDKCHAPIAHSQKYLKDAQKIKRAETVYMLFARCNCNVLSQWDWKARSIKCWTKYHFQCIKEQDHTRNTD